MAVRFAIATTCFGNFSKMDAFRPKQVVAINRNRWSRYSEMTGRDGPKSAPYANLRQWIVAAVKSGMPSFAELGYKFFRKRHYVLNYFICKITTAISEGINNKIKRLKRMAYGYRDVKYFLLKIHQHCGLLSPRLST